MVINTGELFGTVEVEVVKGNSNSCVDAYIESGFNQYGLLTDSQLDWLTDEYSDLIQEYAVENLGCHWD
jgi:hypothetical protein